MCWMWLSAVFAEMNSCSEISRVVAPSAISRSTCVSRAVRPARPRRAGGRASACGATSIWWTAYAAASRQVHGARRLAAHRVRRAPRRAVTRAARRARRSVGTWWKLAGSLAIAPSRVQRDRGTVEPLEQGRQAGQRDDQLRHGAGAQERLDRRTEEGQRRLQLTVRGVQERGVAGHEALEEPDVVLAEVGDALVPGLQRALRVRLRAAPARRSTACRRSSRGCRARAPPPAAASVSSSASSTRPADCRPSTYAATRTPARLPGQRRDLAGQLDVAIAGCRSRPARAPR